MQESPVVAHRPVCGGFVKTDNRRACGTRLVRAMPLFLILMSSLLIPPVPLLAEDCEILKVFAYERRQEEIVTDWYAGTTPYRKYQVVIYPCVNLTIRDNSSSYSEKVIELSAAFSDQGTIVKKLWCDRKGGDNGDIYTCTACFESDSLPVDLKCSFR